MSKLTFVVIALAAINVCSAVAVVYMKHLSRQSYAELSEIQQTVDDLDVQWSQLQIEESTFSEHGLVDRTARDRLGMVLPAQKNIIMISRQP